MRIPSIISQKGRQYSGGRANAYGMFTWDWGSADLDVPEDGNVANGVFSNNEWKLDQHYDSKGITKVGNRLRFYLNPTLPSPAGKPEAGNYRQEIAEHPWDARKPIGTEEWIGGRFIFGDNYIRDIKNENALWQTKTIDGTGVTYSNSPAMLLQLCSDNQYGSSGGEIGILLDAGGTDHNFMTGIVPKAKDNLDFVLHIIHGDDANGLFEVWLNGKKYFSKQERTIYPDRPWGGNNKFGIYKWPWKDQAKINTSAANGVTEMEIFLDSLRILRKRATDQGYKANEYNAVKFR